MNDRAAPNLLLITTDQQRWDALGCTGGWVRTPNLDRLAEEGVLFSQAVTTSPVCVPARHNLATGTYCHNSGLWDNADPHTLDPNGPTWMQALRAAGYRTSLFGKTHWHPHRGDIREREHLLHAYGLDDVDETVGPRASTRTLCHMTARWHEKQLWDAHAAEYRERFATKGHMVRPSALPLEEYYDTYVGERARAYLAGYDHAAPFFCWVSFGGPHEPWDTPEPYASSHDPSAMPEARAAFSDEHAERPRGVLDRKIAKPIAFEEGETARMRADYAGNIELIDAEVGAILQALEQRGELANTAIVFSSDHGEMNGDAGLIHKGNFLDGAVRVPLIVRPPRGEGARSARCDSPAEWLDVGPTLCAFAGTQPQHAQFGRSLLPAVADPSTEHRADALSELGGELMLMTPEWKIVLNREMAPYLLFDRTNDPYEQRNLAGSPAVADTERALRERCLERVGIAQRGIGIPGN